MASAMQNPPSHAQVFVVPVSGAIPGAPFVTGPTELELTLRLGAAHPEKVIVRFRPESTEFQLKLLRWARAEHVHTPPAQLSLAAAKAQPVLEYHADPALLARLRGDLADEAALAAYLKTAPPVLDWTGYRLGAIAFEQRP